MEQLLGWPAKRFERFYKAFTQRSMAEELKQRKLDMINAISSNPNYDGEKVDKSGEIRKVEEAFDDAIGDVYSERREPEIDKSNPFFAAIDKGMEWIDTPNVQKKLDAAGAPASADAEESPKTDFEIDQ